MAKEKNKEQLVLLHKQERTDGNDHRRHKEEGMTLVLLPGRRK